MLGMKNTSIVCHVVWGKCNGMHEVESLLSRVCINVPLHPRFIEELSHGLVDICCSHEYANENNHAYPDQGQLTDQK